MHGKKFINHSYVCVISGCTGIQSLYDSCKVAKDDGVKQSWEKKTKFTYQATKSVMTATRVYSMYSGVLRCIRVYSGVFG